MSKALTRQNTQKSMDFGQKQEILKKINQDYQAFKIFKSELAKSTNKYNIFV